MTREIDLLAYLPYVMKNYLEMQKIAEAENPEFKLLWEADELMRLNLYIVTAQEEGLRRYENILGIYPSPSDSFAVRRKRVLSRWNDFTPYTFRYLIGLLEVLTDGNFEVITNFPEYELNIKVSVSVSGVVDEIDYIIKEIIPCNLTVLSKNELTVSTQGRLYLGVGLMSASDYFITNDFKANYTESGHLRTAFLVVPTANYAATSDFKSTYSPRGKLKSYSSLVQTNVKQVSNDFKASYAASGNLTTVVGMSRTTVITQNI